MGAEAVPVRLAGPVAQPPRRLRSEPGGIELLVRLLGDGWGVIEAELKAIYQEDARDYLAHGGVRRLMTRIVAAPDGSLIRGLLAQHAAEAEAVEEKKNKNVTSQFADLMPVRKAG